MTPQEQMELWVKGESIHNDERDECCPDFSCCKPELLASVAVRERFRDGTPQEQSSMLVDFLGALIKSEGRDDVTIVNLLDQ